MKHAAQVGTDTAEIYAIAPEQLYNLVKDGTWKEKADEIWGESDKRPKVMTSIRNMQNIIREHGGAVIETGADGMWDVTAESETWGKPVKEMGFKAPYGEKKAKRVAARFFSRIAAAVTTNSTYIYAIAPEFLMRMLDGGRFYEIGKQTHGVNGDADAPYTYEFQDGIELMNAEILGNYGAVFKLNQDGYINLEVPPDTVVTEEEAAPQIPLAKKWAGEDSGGTMWTPEIPPVNNINPADGSDLKSTVEEYGKIWQDRGDVIGVSAEKVDGIPSIVVTVMGEGSPIIADQYNGFPIVVRHLENKVAARYLRGFAR
jgi:hypothetical protein